MGRYFADMTLFDLLNSIKRLRTDRWSYSLTETTIYNRWSTHCMALLLSLYFRIEFTVTDSHNYDRGQ